MNKRIFVLTDTQVKEGHSFDYLQKLGMFIVEKKPDYIIGIGDFADMPSLSTYDIGKKAFEGRQYTKDIVAAQEAMGRFLLPLMAHNAMARANKKKLYQPKMIMCLGNHEERINRAINNDRKLEGLISISDLGYESYGWEVVPFLQVKIVEGIAFSHYFTTGTAGRPASTAQAQLRKQHMSCIAGHQQGIQIAIEQNAEGKRITSIIAGSGYEHNEDYMGKQGNNHWRGHLMLNEVNDGEFDVMPISLNYINRKYA